MIDPQILRKSPDLLRTALKNRGADTTLFERALAADETWRKAQTAQEQLRHKQKELTPNGKPTPEQQALLKDISSQVKELVQAAADLESKMFDALLFIPNMPDPSVPVGADAGSNQELRVWGQPRRFDFKVQSHDEIGTRLGLLNFEQGSKIASARFTVLRGWGAKLERALINFMLDLHTDRHGYTEIFPPVLVNSKAMTGTGQLPKFAEDMFKCAHDDLYLAPTAEVPVTNLHMDEIIETELPIKYAAYSACFRREAGTYGADTRGLIRQHQFNKVELVQFVRPEQSMPALEELTGHAEEVLKQLELPYRVMALSTGDMGFASSKTYDLEVWFPSQNTYREISSCSNFKDFQARRAKIRYRPSKDAKPEYVHTLNGSGLAVGRTFAAILENYQNLDGTVTVPKVLKAYLGGIEVLG